VLLRPALDRLEIFFVSILLSKIVHVPMLLLSRFVSEVLLTLLFIISRFELALRSLFFSDISEEHLIILSPVFLTLL